MNLAAVILAAGYSRRLGRPKQMVIWDGETLLERAIRVARGAMLAPVIVVVPDAEWIEKLSALGVDVVLNTKAVEGMAASIRCGVAAAQESAVTGVVMMACDQVALTAEHLRLLVAEPERVTASAYAGRVGVPAYFPAYTFEELMKLQGDVGARDLLRDAASVSNESLALDLDTEADLARARELLS